jgi:broad specificity phosphatase PhoE
MQLTAKPKGTTSKSAEEHWPELAAKKLQDWFGIAAPGGERWGEIAARASRALETIRRGPFPAIVVGHQGIHAVIDFLLTGRRPESFTQGYCEVRTYDL